MPAKRKPMTVEKRLARVEAALAAHDAELKLLKDSIAAFAANTSKTLDAFSAQTSLDLARIPK